jgi:hypothetical protein
MDRARRHRPGGLAGSSPVIAEKREQLYAALVLLVTALFVASGAVPVGWRKPLRAAALIGFAAAALIMLWRIVLWGAISTR